MESDEESKSSSDEEEELTVQDDPEVKVAKAEQPVTVMHRKKNVEELHVQQQVAVNLLKNQLTTQSDSMQERLRKRKLELFKRRELRALNPNGQNQSVILESPNLSKSKCFDSFERLNESCSFTKLFGRVALERGEVE